MHAARRVLKHTLQAWQARAAIADAPGTDADMGGITSATQTRTKPTKPLVRAQTPQELHRKEWHVDQKAEHRNVSSATKARWETWTAAWDGHSPQQLRRYNELSEQSKFVVQKQID